jgi:uncharacterized protein YjeT (DUF2065 family)
LEKEKNNGRSDSDSASSSIKIGDIRAGRDVVIQLARSSVASKYHGKIEAFFEEYLCSESSFGSVPFGGRNSDLATLNSWLFKAGSEPRYLVTAPAGRGKSALLVRWIEQLKQTVPTDTHESWHLLFAPISIRYETHRPEIFYELIAARLAEILDVELRPTQTDKAVYYSDQCRVLLDTAIEKRIRILLIVDGIDEALGERFHVDWFPRIPGSGLRIVLSARLQVGDHDSRGWIQRVRWERDVRVFSHELCPLTSNGIRDLLVKMGAPLDELATRPEVIGKLFELSEGEPLLLRLYTEDLWGQGAGVRRLTVVDLDMLSPGFSGYFRHWLNDQEKSWKDASETIEYEQLEWFLSIFACAHGRLRATDFKEVFFILQGKKLEGRVERYLHPLRRFLIGIERASELADAGFILSHPKFGFFLREEYLDQRGVQLTNEAFVAWGRTVTIRLNSGDLKPEAAPHYLLQYHAQHLREVGAAVEAYLEMVERGWLLAWEALEGGYRGFIRDVTLALEMLNRDDPFFLTQLLRCQMMISSVASMGSSVPSAFLIEGFNSSILSLNQIQHWLEFKPVEERLTVLAAVAEKLPADVLAETLATARGIDKADIRGRVLAQIVPLLPEGERINLFNELLDTFHLMNFGDDQAMLLERLAPSLSDGMLIVAHAAAKNIKTAHYSIRARAAIASLLSKPEQTEILHEVFQSAKQISDPDNRSKAFEALARTMPATLLSDLIAAAKVEPASNNKIRLLATLVSVAPDNEKGDLISAIDTIARNTRDSYSLAYAKIALSRCCPSATRFDALKDALNAIERNNGGYSYLDMIEDFSADLPHDLLSDLLKNVVGVKNEYLRTQALASVARYLTPDLQKIALADGLEIKDRAEKGQVLTALAPFLPPDQLTRAIRGMLAVGDEVQRINALISLAESMSGNEREGALANAVSATRTVSSSYDRAALLVKLQPHLEEGQINDALEIIRSIRVLSARLSAMSAFAKYLRPADFSDVLIMASAAYSSESRELSDSSLRLLAEYMPVEQRNALHGILASRPKATARDDIGEVLIENSTSDIDKELDRLTFEPFQSEKPYPWELGSWPGRRYMGFSIRQGSDSEKRALVHLEGLLARAADLSSAELSSTLALATELTLSGNLGSREIEYVRARVVVRLAQYLSHEQLDEALTFVRQIGESHEQVHALEGLEPFLQPTHIVDVFDIVNSMEDADQRILGFAAIASKLTPQFLSEFLPMVRAAERDASVAIAIEKVTRYLPQADFDEVLIIAMNLKNVQARVAALEALAARIPPQQVPIVLERLIRSDEMRERSPLISIIPFLAKHIGTSQLPLIRKAVSDAADWFP